MNDIDILARVVIDNPREKTPQNALIDALIEQKDMTFDAAEAYVNRLAERELERRQAFAASRVLNGDDGLRLLAIRRLRRALGRTCPEHFYVFLVSGDEPPTVGRSSEEECMVPRPNGSLVSVGAGWLLRHVRCAATIGGYTLPEWVTDALPD